MALDCIVACRIPMSSNSFQLHLTPHNSQLRCQRLTFSAVQKPKISSVESLFTGPILPSDSMSSSFSSPRMI